MTISVSFPYFSPTFAPQYPTNVRVDVDFRNLSYRSQITTVQLYYRIGASENLVLLDVYGYNNQDDVVTYTPDRLIVAPDDPYGGATKEVAVIVHYRTEYQFLGAEFLEFEFHGTVGSKSQTEKTDGILEYTIIDKDTIEFRRKEGEYTSENPASALIWTETQSAFAWFLKHRGGNMIDLDTAASEKLVSVVQKYESYEGVQRRRYAVLRLTFLKSGTFEILPRITWKTTDQLGTGYYTLTYVNSQQFRVYNPAKPTMEIVSVVPSEYKSGDADPLNGSPPYSVIFRDTSQVTDGDQIPQKTIVFDFGDTESGTSNKISISNTSADIISAPNQTHQFGGYGPYICELMIIDKRDNSAAYTVSFAPSTTPRLIKTPTLTPLAGDQPLLVAGNAHVAGDPLPTVTWAYTLQGGDPDYYAGDKEGVFAEMSLLAGGTYAVTCETTDDDTTIDTTTFSVVVNPQQIYADDPVAMQNFELIVYDRETGQAADRCRQHITPTYTQNYGKRDTFSLQIPRTYPYQHLMMEGDVIAIGYLGKARLMQITTRSRSEETISISGYECSPPQRVALISTRSTSDNGYDVQKCSAEALLRYFATTNLRTPGVGTNYRGAPEFRVVGENMDRGGKATYSARYETALTILEEMCASYGLGWSTALQNGTTRVVGWKVVEGADRTRTSGGEYAVVFSETLKNCRFGYDQGSLADNVAVGAGAGDGATREYTFYGSPTASGFGRREMFVDAGDAADADEVARMCNLELERAKQLTISLSVLPTCQWVFGIDYAVGDFVTVDHPDRGSLDLRITSATFVRRDSGDELDLTLGYDYTNYMATIRRTQQANSYARR